MSAPGRPKREYRSAQREGTPVSAPGRPKRELRPLEGQRSGESRKRWGPSIVRRGRGAGTTETGQTW
jgi:hypothetical protein